MRKEIILGFVLGAILSLTIGLSSYLGWHTFFKKSAEKAKIYKAVSTVDVSMPPSASSKTALLFTIFENTPKGNAWNQLFLLDGESQNLIPLILPQDTFRFILPQGSNEKVYFYRSSKEDRFSRELELWTYDIKSKETKRISSFTSSSFPEGLLLSPDGKKLAFFLHSIINRKHQWEVWLFEEEKGTKRVFVEHFDHDMNLPFLQWSVDSSKLYYLKKIGKDYILHFSDAREAKPVPTQEFQNIAWEKIPFSRIIQEKKPIFLISPDLKKIIYALSFGNKSILYIADTKSGEIKEIEGLGLLKKAVFQDADNLFLLLEEKSGSVLGRFNLSSERFTPMNATKSPEMIKDFIFNQELFYILENEEGASINHLDLSSLSGTTLLGSNDKPSYQLIGVVQFQSF